MIQHGSQFYLLFCVIVALIEPHLVFTFYLEELKWMNYEVDILQTPVKREEDQILPVVHVISKYGQVYQCLLPQIEDDESSERETLNEKPADIKDLLVPLKTGMCLTKSKDWWTYELCFGHHIKQFHIEDGKIAGQIITLGLYESDYDWDNQTDQDKFRHVKQKYHSQTYSNGTRCDLTGLPRNTEVRFFCEEDAGDYIHRVDEPGTCSYVITVHTSRLCSHPQLKPLPSNKANSIPCNPLLNEEQYSKYLVKVNEEKTLAEEKRNQWLTDQQERLKRMKKWANENFIHIESDDITKLTEIAEGSQEDSVNKLITKDDESDALDPNAPVFPAGDEIITTKDYTDSENEADEEVDNETKMLIEEYDQEIERLKTYVPPGDFASVKKELLKQFENVLTDVKEKVELDDIDNEEKEATYSKLASTLNMLMEKLDQAEKDVTKATNQLKKARSALINTNTEDINRENTIKDSTETEVKQENVIETNKANLKLIEDENSQSAELEDDKLHVRIRRLDRKSPDSNGKLHEMDFMQRKRLEQAVKEKLEKAGLDTGGRRIEVKIITAGYYDNEDGKDFHSLSDDETSQFQNMIMALLTGQQDAVQEMERHKKLEENYKFVWGIEEKEDEE